ncbi:cell wall-active antibiotics response protein LiaF [Paenibacillus abyssi]|uniref:cell wall-active antibiotics response protein LiaF n=1 Tax=Paenibacillus abyssi TaxID=1340531 RepID=UPI001E57F13C|nr:cell wall-active antibiotics response protein LiaF [Paenibacillus abyssi]
MKRFFWGLIIIAVGVAFLLRQMGILPFDIGDIISIFWPVILILFGIEGLIGYKDAGSYNWWSWLTLGLGIYFLGRNLGMLHFSIGEIIPYAIPAVIILFGLSMIFRPQGKQQGPAKEEWQAYPPASNIPPAPPLHPDPTKPGAGDFSDMDPYGSDVKRSTYEEKYRSGASSPKHERVEWWNHDAGVQTRSGFIGDIHLGQDYWELKPMNISHFIGDTVLDLTKAQIPYGETKLTISSFIGDVKIFLPNDYEVGVHVVSSAFIGDSTILDRKEGGIFRNSNIETPAYHDCEKKIRLVVSTFIGDVRVTKVG